MARSLIFLAALLVALVCCVVNAADETTEAPVVTSTMTHSPTSTKGGSACLMSSVALVTASVVAAFVKKSWH